MASVAKNLPTTPKKYTLSKSENLWLVALRRLFRQRSGIVGMIILGFLILIAVFAPVIAPFDPNETLIGKEDIRKRTAPCIHLLGCPSDQPQHLMGVDGNVRDEFSRIVHGTRISLVVGFITVGFAIVAGTVLGALAGYMGGWTDNGIMRFMDVLLAFPFLLLTIAFTSALRTLFNNNEGLETAFRNSVPEFIFDQRGLLYAMIAIAIVSIPIYARIIRSTVLSVKEEESQAYSFSTRVTQRVPAPDCSGHAGNRDRYPGNSRALVPGTGCPTPDPRMGRYAGV
jgi:ABC-type dipeptide/oligopeptide/nickel transport system permease subunit